MSHVSPTETSHIYLTVNSDEEQFDPEHKIPRFVYSYAEKCKERCFIFNLVEQQTCHLSPSNVGVCFVPSRLKFIP